MKCKHCDVPVVSLPMPGQSSGVYWTHDFGNDVRMIYARASSSYQEHAATPRQPIDLSLWIYLPSTRQWECHQNGSLEIRDYLRAIWRAAGCATAVSV